MSYQKTSLSIDGRRKRRPLRISFAVAGPRSAAHVASFCVTRAPAIPCSGGRIPCSRVEDSLFRDMQGIASKTLAPQHNCGQKVHKMAPEICKFPDIFPVLSSATGLCRTCQGMKAGNESRLTVFNNLLSY
jgi:hypothetical protein